MTIAAGGKLLEITGLMSGTKYTIDSDIMEIGLAEGVGLWTAKSIGEFPVLKPGSNNITGSGWSKLEIEKRERFL
jgi:phage-related protein